MTSLKTLKFTEAPAQLKADPKEQRRQKLVAQLEQQKHMVIDPAYSIMQSKWTKDETGNRVKTETPKRLRRWWHEVGQDGYVLCVRYGAKPIEFEKGKAAVVAVGKDGLVKVIETLIAATKAGELDSLIEGLRK